MVSQRILFLFKNHSPVEKRNLPSERVEGTVGWTKADVPTNMARKVTVICFRYIMVDGGGERFVQCWLLSSKKVFCVEQYKNDIHWLRKERV